jgi:poly(A) polymerase
LSSTDKPRIFKNTIIFPAAIDADAVKIIRRLKRYGHEAFLVGGCVRDLLLGAIPKDFDVATSARPRQVRRLFRNSTIIGRRFKLAHVLFRDKIIEVSTFRKSPVQDSRHFESDGLLILRDNVYGGPQDDAVRRDFTVNSLFFDVDDQVVIDYTGGVADIENRVLRTIGDPHIRICEDPVRILRAVKFSCRLGLNIDPGHEEAMAEHVSELSKCAPPRVKEEMIRILSCGASRAALMKLIDLGAFAVIFPRLSEALDKEARFFGSKLTGKEFLLGVAAAVDRLDMGKRRYTDALYLSMLFAHHAGAAVVDAIESGDIHHDRAALIDGTLRPITSKMGVSKRDLNRIKQIVIAFPRFERRKWRGRPSQKEFVRREYFRDSLEFYRFTAVGLEKDLSIYDRWFQRWREGGARQGGRPQGTRRQGGRKRSTKAAPKGAGQKGAAPQKTAESKKASSRRRRGGKRRRQSKPRPQP